MLHLTATMKTVTNMLLAFVMILAQAITGFSSANASERDGDPLPFEQAFKVQAFQAGNNVKITFAPKPGYKLFADSVRLSGKGLLFKNKTWKGTEIVDLPFVGEREAILHHGELTSLVHAQHQTEMTVTVQGCSPQGICYVPHKFNFKVAATN